MSPGLRASILCQYRVRDKMKRWNLIGSPGKLDRQVLKNFKMLSCWCPPRVLATYLRTCWNGWVTDRRFRTCITGSKHSANNCRLGYLHGEDSIEHYSLCPVFWAFACAPRPIRRCLRRRRLWAAVQGLLGSTSSPEHDRPAWRAPGGCA